MAALSTVSDYNSNNIHLIQQQEQEEEHHHNSISSSREQDSFHMLAHHLSIESQKLLTHLEACNVQLRILKQTAILDNKMDKLSL
jgi:hypothetical protein